MALMTPAPEQITPETVALIASLAKASGLSVDDYLRRILAEAGQTQRQAEPLNLAELDRLLDELSEGTEHIAPLPANFSRADIYGDHA